MGLPIDMLVSLRSFSFEGTCNASYERTQISVILVRHVFRETYYLTTWMRKNSRFHVRDFDCVMRLRRAENVKASI